ncbi:Cyclic pyranopterin monophosphate synthase [subsurface metagenome]
MKKQFSHVDKAGNIQMVDVGDKEVTKRVAKARCRIMMNPSTLMAVTEGKIKKGNVFTTAKIAGILAAKRVDELIPLCHTISINHVDIFFDPELDKGVLIISSEVGVTAQTGAEMEALQAAAQAALTVYDMCKAVDRGMVISDLELVEKSGGRSGLWKRE